MIIKDTRKKENIVVAIAALIEYLNNNEKEIKPDFYVLHPSTKVDAKAKELQKDGIIVEWANGLTNKTVYEDFDVEDLKNVLVFLLSI